MTVTYVLLVKPPGNTGYELVHEDTATGNTERTAKAAAEALKRSYENDGLEVVMYRLKDRDPSRLPGVNDLRRELGRAPTVAEYRAARGLD